MTTLEILKAARELISDPARWTQGVLARTMDGKPASLREASKWCALGACAFVNDVGADYELKVTLHGERYARVDPSKTAVADYNDNRSHSEVLALFDRTIARLEAQP